MKTCENCSYAAMPGYRYCTYCKKKVLRKLQKTGYLTSIGDNHIGQRRTYDMKEKQHETRLGTEQG